jgi:hypothetical protein
MLYLLFFLLRDGSALSKRIQDAIPLPPVQERDLFRKFNAQLVGASQQLRTRQPSSRFAMQPGDCEAKSDELRAHHLATFRR